MFTGIVSAIGRVVATQRDDRGLELTIAAPYQDLELGESVAVDGACLTVERTGRTGESGKTDRSAPPAPPGSTAFFTAHVVGPSLERTNFASYGVGRRVNLERALRAGDRLSGHMVQGHVDAQGGVLRVDQHGDSWLVDIQLPLAVAEVTVPLGSIAVDGVSLTVNAIPSPGEVQVSLIPFTLQHTTLGERRPGDRVHLEGDLLGKYVAALVAPRLAAQADK